MFKQLMIFFLIEKYAISEVLIINTCGNDSVLNLREKDVITVHATKNSNVFLKCNYCSQSNYQEMLQWSKIWEHRTISGNFTYNKITSRSSAKSLNSLNKFYVNESDSSLMIRDVSINDTGFYSCLLNLNDNETAKSYFLDIVESFENIIDNIEWLDFWKQYILPVSRRLNHWGLHSGLDLLSEWTDWTKGKQVVYFKRKKSTLVLNENSYASLVCPKSDEDNGIESGMVWKKNSKELKRSDSANNRYIIDELNNLFLLNVQKDDEGTYVCETADGLRIRKIRIRINLKDDKIIFTKNFRKHLRYLTNTIAVTFILFVCSLRYFWSRELIYRQYRLLNDEENI